MGNREGLAVWWEEARDLPGRAAVDTHPILPRNLSAVDELAGLVLGYLRDHPDAADTLQGVAEWWIPRQQIRVDVMNLQRALGHLVARGLVEEVGSAGPVTYRLALAPPGEDAAGEGEDGAPGAASGRPAEDD